MLLSIKNVQCTFAHYESSSFWVDSLKSSLNGVCKSLSSQMFNWALDVFLPVDQFVRLCREPVEGQSEVGSGGGQSSHHSRRASEGKSKLQQKKNTFMIAACTGIH